MKKTKYQYQRRDLVSEQQVEITQILTEVPKTKTEVKLEENKTDYHENYYG
jgi:hypothetical protein